MDYFISYDIEDNKSRTKLFERLKDFGLKPIQKSLFYGELSRAEKVAIKGILSKHCGKNDKALIATVNLDFNDTIGHDKSDFEKPEFGIF